MCVCVSGEGKEGRTDNQKRERGRERWGIEENKNKKLGGGERERERGGGEKDYKQIIREGGRERGVGERRTTNR